VGSSRATQWVFDRTSGHLALDYANTVSGRATTPIERLDSYDALVAFAEQTGLLSAAAARRHESSARHHPQEAERALQEAVELREAIYHAFKAVSEGRAPERRDLGVLSDRHARLRLDPDLEWRAAAGPDALDAFLAPVVRAGIDLLVSAKRTNVKACDKDTCRFLFLDTSKNHSRRWCDMKQCGNVEKARRYVQRHRD